VRTIDTVIVGAGHAGLAMSRCLADRGIDHVVLERGEVANAWRTERWDSLRLLTPNWQRRLPGFSYEGHDPDGFATMPEVVAFLDRYRSLISAPVRTWTRVTSVQPTDAGYLVTTDRGDWHARAVVVASGACNIPCVPRLAEVVPSAVRMLTPHAYRNPDQLEPGGVLVVGASATGVQLAAELRASGRHVVLSVGEHTRMPRRFRGRDVLWWLHESGVWAQRYDEVEDLERARRLPSPQLAGGAEVDLNTLTAAGVELAGRLAAVRDGWALFSGGLRNVCSLADLKANRMLAGFDEWAGLTGRITLEPTRVPDKPRLRLNLNGGEISTIVWATGFRSDYSWLDVPVLDDRGRLRHDGGVTEVPGLYALGLPVLRRRRSTFLHGIEDDARFVIDHLALRLSGTVDQSVSEAR
jgi:putative flavoprotein involved in K+ transport